MGPRDLFSSWSCLVAPEDAVSSFSSLPKEPRLEAGRAAAPLGPPPAARLRARALRAQLPPSHAGAGSGGVPAACTALISAFGIIPGTVSEWSSYVLPAVWPQPGAASEHDKSRVFSGWPRGGRWGGHRRQTRLMLGLSHMACGPWFSIPLRWSNYSSIKGMKIKMGSARLDLVPF